MKAGFHIRVSGTRGLSERRLKTNLASELVIMKFEVALGRLYAFLLSSHEVQDK